MIDLHPDAIQDLIGKRYAIGARGPDSFDCWGVCAEVYRRAGRALPDYRAASLTHAQTRALVQDIAPDHADWIATPEPWCFVFDRRSGHMGLFWRGYVLHAARGKGVVMERIDHFELAYPSLAFARWRD
jgi:cell wall-associated NlpC family hydrolase